MDQAEAVERSAGGQEQEGGRPSSLCVVCGEPASGLYFSALVCLPCKSFYIRCTKDTPDPTFYCIANGECVVNKATRLRCQCCRYNKCLEAGMCRKEKPEFITPGTGQDICKVCGDIANGVHFGVHTCEGCKKFFRRGLKEAHLYRCKVEGRCPINPRSRNACRSCRYNKCLQVGMSREAIRMGRPKKLTESDTIHSAIDSLQKLQKEHGLMSSDINSKINTPVVSGVIHKEPPSSSNQALASPSSNNAPEIQSSAHVTPDSKINHLRSKYMVSCSAATGENQPHQIQNPRKASFQQPQAQGNAFVESNSFLNHGLDDFLNAIEGHEANFPVGHNGSALNVNDNPLLQQQCLTQMPSSRGTSSSFELNAGSSGNLEDFLKSLEQQDNYNHPGQDPETYKLDSTKSTYSNTTQASTEHNGFRMQSVSNSTSFDENGRTSTQFTMAGCQPSTTGNLLNSCGGAVNTMSCGNASMTNLNKDCTNEPISDDFLLNTSWREHIHNGHCIRFREAYWEVDEDERIHVPLQAAHITIISAVQEGYERMVELSDESKPSRDKAQPTAGEPYWKSIVKMRIINNLKATIGFANKIPGFVDLRKQDKFFLCRHGGFQMMIILSAREYYDIKEGKFLYFFDEKLPIGHPGFKLQKLLYAYGRKIHDMKLDIKEAACLGALSILSPDWLYDIEISRIQGLSLDLKEAFFSYVIDKHGNKLGRKRLQDMMTAMVSLRKLAIWHADYSQNLQFKFKPDQLASIFSNVNLND